MNHEAINERAARALLAWLEQSGVKATSQANGQPIGKGSD